MEAVSLSLPAKRGDVCDDWTPRLARSRLPSWNHASVCSEAGGGGWGWGTRKEERGGGGTPRQPKTRDETNLQGTCWIRADVSSHLDSLSFSDLEKTDLAGMIHVIVTTYILCTGVPNWRKQLFLNKLPMEKTEQFLVQKNGPFFGFLLLSSRHICDSEFVRARTCFIRAVWCPV